MWSEPDDFLQSEVIDTALGLIEHRNFYLGGKPSFAERMMVQDTLHYLPYDVLTKVDRASMAVSLEARAPLLDYELYKLAWQLPQNMKIRGREGKWILRQILYRYIPRHLLDQPKMGFTVPIGAWLRGPLREWAEDCLSEDQLKKQGYYNPEPIRKAWQDHLDGRINNGYRLWSILMFQMWREEWM